MKPGFLSQKFFLYTAIFFLILLFICTHLVKLGSLPKGLQSDEASFLMNAYSLATTQNDEDGNRLPIWFDSLIDAKPALYSYLQLPFVLMFGPTTIASRIPAAILGALSIFLVYWVLSFLVKKNHAVLCSILLIISPWHIIVSRATQEVILAFVFSLIAIGAYLSLLENKKQTVKWWLVFVVACALAMYSYHSSKVFLPLLFLGWSGLDVFFFQLKKDTKNIQKHLLLNGILLCTALVITFSFPQSLERFKAIGFLHEVEPKLILEEQIRSGTGSSPFGVMRIFYNKVVFYGFQIISTYSQHFTVDFLFMTGGEPSRYKVPWHGLFYHIELFLLPLGMFLGLHTVKTRRWAAFMAVWLLVSPVAAALTAQEIPSMIRAFPMVVPLIVFIAYALIWLWSHRKQVWARVALACVLVGYLWGMAYFAHQFIVQQPRYQPWQRNRAEEQLSMWLVEHAQEYDKVHISTLRDLYMFLVLADPSLLADLQSSYPSRRSDNFLLGKYFFHESECAVPVYPVEQKVLYVVRANCDLQPGFQKVTSFGYDDNAQVYDLLERTPSETKTETGAETESGSGSKKQKGPTREN